MKLCILSMQNIVNYGSVLQAYALMQILTRMGHEVKFIDIQGDSDLESICELPNQNITNTGGKRGFLYFYHRITNHYQRNRIKNFQKKILKIEASNNDKKYDICVIGSDEVFNCNQLAEWGFSSQLYGKVDNADKVITYAASCGQTTFLSLPEEYKSKIQIAFKNISAFSVRDKNTMDFARAFNINECFFNLDPTLVYKFDDETQNDVNKRFIPPKTCLVYAYQDRISDATEINLIKDFCKKKGLKLIAAGAYQSWIKKQLMLSPFDLLIAFRQSEFVITDTFHGAIFSVKYAKKFAVIIRESNKNKLQDLVDRLEINNHLLNDMSKIEKAYKTKKDEAKIDTILEKEQVRTVNYLKENLR